MLNLEQGLFLKHLPLLDQRQKLATTTKNELKKLFKLGWETAFA
jgi:hypothetical protein